jgi:putative NADH-flavin reductase
MNIALIGATGFIGSALLREALARGHDVTAIVRDTSKLAPAPGLHPVALDVADEPALAGALRDRDAVISAFSGHSKEDVRGEYVRGVRAIVSAVKRADVPRFLLVGGAGSLEVAPGLQLVDAPDFPAQWKGSALGARDALEMLRAEPDLDWTMLSPSAFIHPGERTGRFRLGGDQLLTSAAGKSEISVEDFALAMIDELERPAHSRRRFTAGY